MQKILSLVLAQAFLALGGTAHAQLDHTVEVFPRGIMLPDASNVKITLKNDTNRPLYCESLKAEVTLRDKELDIEFVDYLEVKNSYLRPSVSGTWLPNTTILDQYKADFPNIKISKVGAIQSRCFFGITSPLNLGKSYQNKAFDPRGFYLYAQNGNSGGPIDVWNTMRGTMIKTINTNSRILFTDAYGHLLLSDMKTKGTNNIVIFDPETEQEVARINDVMDPGYMSPDSKYLFGSTSSEYKVLKVWDLSNGKLVSSSTEAKGCYYRGALATQCAVISYEGTGIIVKFFSLPDLKLTSTLAASSGDQVSWSYDGRYVALVSNQTAWLYEKINNGYVARGTLVDDNGREMGPDTQVIFSGVDYKVFVHTGWSMKIYNINSADSSLVTISGLYPYQEINYSRIAVSNDASTLVISPYSSGVNYTRNYAAFNWTITSLDLRPTPVYSPTTNMIVGSGNSTVFGDPKLNDTLYPLDY